MGSKAIAERNSAATSSTCDSPFPRRLWSCLICLCAVWIGHLGLSSCSGRGLIELYSGHRICNLKIYMSVSKLNLIQSPSYRHYETYAKQAASKTAKIHQEASLWFTKASAILASARIKSSERSLAPRCSILKNGRQERLLCVHYSCSPLIRLAQMRSTCSKNVCSKSEEKNGLPWVPM